MEKGQEEDSWSIEHEVDLSAASFPHSTASRVKTEGLMRCSHARPVKRNSK
jgi:hypothetical protein